MSSAPKYYLLYIDGVSDDPIKFWAIGEVDQFISRHSAQVLTSEHLELKTDSGALLLD